jgi:tungstate transport system substrate-binding protein
VASFKNRGDLTILVEGDKRLSINTALCWSTPKHPQVKKDPGQQFVDWVVSPQASRRSPARDRRRAIVFPNARDEHTGHGGPRS